VLCIRFTALTDIEGRRIIPTMTEHWFMTAMLAFVVLQVAFVAVLAYKVFRRSERIEALTAATYLEARKALSQSR
jgi:ABC-type spermidine/putrescine transport system permease subunit II